MNRNGFIRRALLFYEYFKQEILNPANYILAFIIGFVFNLVSFESLTSVFLYIFPLFAFYVINTCLKFKNRYLSYLQNLPGEYLDPAFVVDKNGEILVSAGKTQTFFKTNYIERLIHLFTEHDAHLILEKASENHENSPIEFLELYSPVSEKWYQIQMKTITGSGEIIIWMSDINPVINLDTSIYSLDKFSNSLMDCTKRSQNKVYLYEQLAWFLLNENYRGVLIMMRCKEGLLYGQMFKHENGTDLKSDIIQLLDVSQSSFKGLRKTDRVTAASKDVMQSQQIFEEKYKFDRRIKSYFGFSITDFIHYSNKEFSVIAFNKKGGIHKYDLAILETSANLTVSVVGRHSTDFIITEGQISA